MPYTPPDLHDHDLTDALSAVNVKAWLSTVATYADGLIAVEDLHVVGGTDEPAYESPFDAGTAAFYKDPFERVWLSGYLTAGTASVGDIGPVLGFTLPSGYCPADDLPTTATVDISGDGTGEANAGIVFGGVVVETDGSVQIDTTAGTPGNAGVNNTVSEGFLFYLDGISFRAA